MREGYVCEAYARVSIEDLKRSPEGLKHHMEEQKSPNIIELTGSHFRP
jgi:hypothetical protein